MTPPTWSQVPARAAGASARSAANRAPRATDQTMTSVRALALRPARLDIGPPFGVEAPGWVLRNATGGHVPLPIRGRFLKRFSDDYPSRYGSVLRRENIRIFQDVTFYLASIIKERFRRQLWTASAPLPAQPQGTEPGRPSITYPRTNLALCQTGGFAISLDFDMRPHIGRRAIHACLVILTLSRVGNYHEQFIYRRVG